MSVVAYACPGCGRSARPVLRTEGAFLQTANALTTSALWFVGILVAFAAIVSVAQAVAILFQGVRASVWP